jgi:hypothetical protein
VASTSSSTKKAARLAQKGKGKRVRFQGGTIFPLAVAATLILGLALIVYGRQTLPAADASPPTINDHWHAASGLYLCDGWVQLNGALEERDSRGQFTNTNFVRSGIHSHDDGVIHWHPYNSRGVGKNAVLGVFLDTYEVELGNESLSFPSLESFGPNPNHLDQAPSVDLQEFIEGETQCNGEDAEVSVRAWGSFTDTDGGTKYIANMDEIHIDSNSMVFGIYFTANDEPQVMPPWAQQLPQLGAIDSGQVLPDDLESLIEGDDLTVPSTVPGDTSDTTDTGTTESTDTTDPTDPTESTDTTVGDEGTTDTSGSTSG